MRLKEEGFKVEVIFYAEIITAIAIRREKEEKDQVKSPDDRKGVCTVSAVYTNIGTVCVTAGAVLKAQRIQLEQTAKKRIRKGLEEGYDKVKDIGRCTKYQREENEGRINKGRRPKNCDNVSLASFWIV